MSRDVCIVGGGLVGLTAALAFSAQGRSVTLLEAFDLEGDTPALLDARSLALSHSTVRVYQSLGLGSPLRSMTAPIRHIHVSSAGRFGVTRLNAVDYGLDAMGHVVEYHRLMKLLLDAVRANPLIELLCPASCGALSQHASGVTLKYRFDDKDQEFDAALVIVADGARSPLREFLGIQARVRDFGQSAIIANVQIKGDGGGVAYERFTSRGPLALLPLPEHRYALVWSNRPQRASKLLELDDDSFLRALYDSFGYRLGYFSALGARDLFPLRLTRSEQLVSGCCVFIGNAANTLHPVAGQGLNLAVRDVAVLYDLLLDQIFDVENLRRQLALYPAARQKDQNLTVGLSSSLVELFSNDMPLLDHARAAGLAALDLCPALKKEVGWLGMGFGSGASSLMRGTQT